MGVNSYTNRHMCKNSGLQIYRKIYYVHNNVAYIMTKLYRFHGRNESSNSRGTKVEKMLTLAPERYTAGFCMVAKVIPWCI